MFSMLSSTQTQQTQQDSKEQPKILTKGEILQITSKLPYALPSMVKLRNTDPKGKGKRTDSNKNPHFPSPRQTANLTKVFDIIQSVTYSAFASDTVVETKGAINFALAQLNDFSSYQNIFDLYRIAMVEVTFRPRASMSTAGTANYPGMLYTVVDLTDSTSLVGTTLNEYPGVIVSEATKLHRHTFVPSIAVAAYAGAFTSYMNEVSPWIDCNSSSVQHYGVKYALTISPATFAYDVTARIHFQFKTVK